LIPIHEEKIMPYLSNADLPASVRHHLPARAQDLYRGAFNRAWSTYSGDARREEIAHRTAWAAVKRRFHKDDDGRWLPTAVDRYDLRSRRSGT
jgi:cation transport regulator